MQTKHASPGSLTRGPSRNLSSQPIPATKSRTQRQREETADGQDRASRSVERFTRFAKTGACTSIRHFACWRVRHAHLADDSEPLARKHVDSILRALPPTRWHAVDRLQSLGWAGARDSRGQKREWGLDSSPRGFDLPATSSDLCASSVHIWIDIVL